MPVDCESNGAPMDGSAGGIRITNWRAAEREQALAAPGAMMRGGRARAVGGEDAWEREVGEEAEARDRRASVVANTMVPNPVCIIRVVCRAALIPSARLVIQLSGRHFINSLEGCRRGACACNSQRG